MNHEGKSQPVEIIPQRNVGSGERITVNRGRGKGDHTMQGTLVNDMTLKVSAPEYEVERGANFSSFNKMLPQTNTLDMWLLKTDYDNLKEYMEDGRIFKFVSSAFDMITAVIESIEINREADNREAIYVNSDVSGKQTAYNASISLREVSLATPTYTRAVIIKENREGNGEVIGERDYQFQEYSKPPESSKDEGNQLEGSSVEESKQKSIWLRLVIL